MTNQNTVNLKMVFILMAVVMCGLPCFADELQEFRNVVLINNANNDGDSFRVKVSKKGELAADHADNTKDFVVRLYFVDCPETGADSASDASRVREQTRYFGLKGAAHTVKFGLKAKKFTKQALSKPFTLYTAFAAAPGRAAKGRIYGFITTATGNDLASLLVANGYARAYGIGRATPGGVSRDETKARLQDLEMAGMMKRNGIWKKSDPDRIVELRAEQRREDEELKIIGEQVRLSKQLKGQINLNKATREELQLIKGIGPVLAEKMIAGRPYKTIDALLKVKGIKEKTLEKIREYLVIE